MKKVQQGFRNKRLVAANKEFFVANKKLHQICHEKKFFNAVKPIKLSKVCIFDELVFTNDLHKIKFVELPKDINANFMVLAVDGIIYKYDLSTKDNLYSFKTNATKACTLYGDDQRLLACDS